MAHQLEAHIPAGDLPPFARGSPATDLKAILFLDSVSPFPTCDEVESEFALVEGVAEARTVGPQLSQRIETVLPYVHEHWDGWTPWAWERYLGVLQKVTVDLMAGTSDRKIQKELDEAPFWILEGRTEQESTQFSDALKAVLRRLPVADNVKDRLHHQLDALLPHAKDAFVQQVHYLNTWLPQHPLPSPDRLVVNADLGGKYLELLSHFRFALTIHVPHKTEHGMHELQESLPFSFFASLPLALIDAILRESARPRKPNALVHSESILRYAVLHVYSVKLDKIASLFEQDVDKHVGVTSWRAEYLEAFEEAMSKSWAQEHHSGSWSPEAARQYWSRYVRVFEIDWKRLDREWVQLVKSFCDSRVLPEIEGVQQHLGMHSLSRISPRAARRYGTTQRAWAAERESRTF
ncbi:Proteophosphoglycan 5 [Rhodotorula toruloides]|nr:Proteophosphoglycan 5 [Rhodotorula toruloides]